MNAEVNAAEVKAALSLFKDKTLPNANREGMEQVCLFLEGESKKNCPPSVTGNLRASITHMIEEDEEGSIIGSIGSNLDYAPFVHQGTGIHALDGNGRKNVPWTYKDQRTGEFVSTDGIEPTPFITMAIDQNRETIINYFKGVLDGSGTSD